MKEIFKDGRTIRHVFASEKCPFTAAILKASYNIETFFDDATTRDHSKLECVDVYAAGAPCQPFSMNGKQRGLFDSRSHAILYPGNDRCCQTKHFCIGAGCDVPHSESETV